MSKLYQIIDEVAAERKLSRKNVAAKLGMTSDLYRKKRGGSWLTSDQLHTVAHFLGYSMETVYDLERS